MTTIKIAILGILVSGFVSIGSEASATKMPITGFGTAQAAYAN